LEAPREGYNGYIIGQKSESIRRTSAYRLGEIGDSCAVEPLIKALADPNIMVRANAAEALGKIGDNRAVEPLIKALADPNIMVRASAAEALGKIGDNRAVEPLIETLVAKDIYDLNPYEVNVCKTAADALDKIDNPKARVYSYLFNGNMEGIMAMNPVPTNYLVEALDHGNFDIHANAALALAYRNDSRSVDPLVGLLSSDKNDSYEIAANALGGMDSPKAKIYSALYFGKADKIKTMGVATMDDLIEALGHGNPHIRENAAKMLKEMNGPRAKVYSYLYYGEIEKIEAMGATAADNLVDALSHKNIKLRKNAAIALGKMDVATTVNPLITVLGDENSDVRIVAAEALGEIGDPLAIEPLIKALGDKDNNVREVSAVALGKIDDRKAKVHSYLYFGEIKKIKAIGVPAEKDLKDALNNTRLRNNAIVALGWIGDPVAVDPLKKTLTDKKSVQVLVKMGWIPEDKELLNLYSQQVAAIIAEQDSVDYQISHTLVHSYFRLGNIYVKEGKISEAVDIYQKAVKIYFIPWYVTFSLFLVIFTGYAGALFI
jgi:HEAT repeat protein